MKLRRGLWILFCFAMLAFAGTLSAPVAQAHSGHAHAGLAQPAQAQAASKARQTQARQAVPAAICAVESAERAHFARGRSLDAAPAQICRLHCCEGAFSACCGLALIGPRLPEAPPKRSRALLAKSLLHEGVPPGALLDPPRS